MWRTFLAADSKTVTSVAAVLATTSQQSTYYKERLDNLVKYAVPKCEHGPPDPGVYDEVGGEPFKPSLKVVQEGVDIFLKVAGKVSPSLSDGFNTFLVSTLAKVAADWNAMWGGGGRSFRGSALTWNMSFLRRRPRLARAPRCMSSRCPSARRGRKRTRRRR